MDELIRQLRIKYPNLTYTAGKQFTWSPETKEIIYAKDATGIKSLWSVLHETGHALLKHTKYESDFSLLKLEVAAWQKAKKIAADFDITIGEDHIQDCLDTYRDWLYKRSICPNCTAKSLQQDNLSHYRCFNCHTVWKVSASRFCRAYRITKDIPISTLY